MCVIFFTNVFTEVYSKVNFEPSLQAAATCAYISLLSTVGERLAARMREALFASLIRQDIAFFDEHGTGELINR